MSDQLRVEVESDLGLAVVEKTFPTPIGNYPANHTFSSVEFYPNKPSWPGVPARMGTLSPQ